MPHFELLAAHMSANIAENLKFCLNELSERKIYLWSDTTPVLHWLKDNR